MKELNQNHTVGYLFKQALEKKMASDLSEKHNKVPTEIKLELKSLFFCQKFLP